MIQFLGKSLICLTKDSSIKKTTNKQSWKLSKVKFGPKLNMQNSAYTKPLHLKLERNWVALCFYWTFRKSFGVIENVKKKKRLGETRQIYDQKISFFAQPWTKYLGQSKENH